MADDTRRLLHETANAPTSPPDLGAIRSRVRRRRNVRRGLAGATAVLLLVGGAALAVDGSGDGREVRTADRPDEDGPDTTEAVDDVDESLDLRSVGALAPEGIAVQTEAGVELRGLDGELLHTLDGYELATEDRPEGLQSTVTNVLPLQVPDGELHWFDPASGLVSAEAPLWNGARVEAEPGRGIRVDSADGVAGNWNETEDWWLSSDHRAVTVAGEGYFDSSLPGARGLESCWVAAQGADRDVHVCNDSGASSLSYYVNGSGGSVTVPDHFGQARTATAAWMAGHDVLVRTEHDSCFVADAMVLRDGDLVPLLGPEGTDVPANPSSAPIGVAADGRAIVHLNAAACDASARDMGVYLVDIDTGERELVWAGAAQLWEVRAWSTLPLAATAEPQPPPEVDVELGQLEQVAPEDIGRDLIVFGDDGITRIDGGVRFDVWDQPVEDAVHDKAGGVIFQDRSVITRGRDGRIDVQRGAIRRVVPNAAAARELVPSSDHPRLWGAFWIDDRPAEPPHGRLETDVWFTREDRSGGERTTLHRLYPMPGGEEEELGIAGGAESGLDGIARLGDGRTLFSTCHIQCAIRPALDDPDPIVQPHWLGGLDGTQTTWGYVRFGVTDDFGDVVDPVLTIHGLDDAVRHQVPLPDGIGWETVVDLSDDSAAALVWSRDWQTGEVTAAIYVDGLDTGEPRVRSVATDQALRFG